MSEVSNKSTGPRTPEGKAISSRNALKHGLTARDVILHDEEEREDFAALQTDLTAELNPAGVLETLLLNRLLRASWDLRRIERIEVESADRRDPAMEKLQLSLERYKMRAERSFYRALREIQALQAERRAQAKADKAQAEAGEGVRLAKSINRGCSHPGTGVTEPISPLPQPLNAHNSSPDDLTPPSVG